MVIFSAFYADFCLGPKSVTITSLRAIRKKLIYISIIFSFENSKTIIKQIKLHNFLLGKGLKKNATFVGFDGPRINFRK